MEKVFFFQFFLNPYSFSCMRMSPGRIFFLIDIFGQMTSIVGPLLIKMVS